MLGPLVVAPRVSFGARENRASNQVLPDGLGLPGFELVSCHQPLVNCLSLPCKLATSRNCPILKISKESCRELQGRKPRFDRLCFSICRNLFGAGGLTRTLARNKINDEASPNVHN